MSEDHHADERDRKRRKQRYGPTTTNPGLRIVMRELAQKDRDADGSPAVTPSGQRGKRRIRVQRRRRKGR